MPEAKHKVLPGNSVLTSGAVAVVGIPRPLASNFGGITIHTPTYLHQLASALISCRKCGNSCSIRRFRSRTHLEYLPFTYFNPNLLARADSPKQFNAPRKHQQRPRRPAAKPTGSAMSGWGDGFVTCVLRVASKCARKKCHHKIRRLPEAQTRRRRPESMQAPRMQGRQQSPGASSHASPRWSTKFCQRDLNELPATCGCVVSMTRPIPSQPPCTIKALPCDGIKFDTSKEAATHIERHPHAR